MAEPKEEKSPLPKSITDFHAHLDVCKQCADHPFELCPEGEKKLREAATK